MEKLPRNPIVPFTSYQNNKASSVHIHNLSMKDMTKRTLCNIQSEQIPHYDVKGKRQRI